MNATHILGNIPPEIQARYNIGPEAKAEVSNEVCGGHFTIETKSGGEVSVDAVELTGTDITMRKIRKS